MPGAVDLAPNTPRAGELCLLSNVLTHLPLLGFPPITGSEDGWTQVRAFDNIVEGSHGQI